MCASLWVSLYTLICKAFSILWEWKWSIILLNRTILKGFTLVFRGTENCSSKWAFSKILMAQNGTSRTSQDSYHLRNWFYENLHRRSEIFVEKVSRCYWMMETVAFIIADSLVYLYLNIYTPENFQILVVDSISLVVNQHIYLKINIACMPSQLARWSCILTVILQLSPF